MIAKLTGRLDSIGDDFIVIDVGGVGYMVHSTTRTLASLPATGSTVELAIETHVREDHIHLYGFASPVEREWFRHLQNVQGVGTKVALAILDVLSPEDIAAAIATENSSALTQASGVGARLAQRIVTELRGKAPATGEFVVVDLATAGGRRALEGDAATQRDAISALINLGYRQAEATTAALRSLRELGEGAELENVIRNSLQELQA